jgi:uncharacterized membrane protein
MKKINIKVLTFVAVMAALANILSTPPLAIPIFFGPFESAIHFSQLLIFISGILAGPAAGLLTGFVGGLYMSFTKIPFIVIGLAILGYSAAFFSKKFNPFFSGVLAWCIQAPYVLVTDYIWFAFFLQNPNRVVWVILFPIMIKLSVEAVICAFLAHLIIRYLKRLGISLQITS